MSAGQDVDRPLQAYYWHYVEEKEAGNDITRYLTALAQGQAGMEDMPEGMQAIARDEKELNNFYTVLYLIYSSWRGCTQSQADELRLQEPQLLTIMSFRALSAEFEPVTAKLLEYGTYNPDSYIADRHLCAWAVPADSPRQLNILISKGRA